MPGLDWYEHSPALQSDKERRGIHTQHNLYDWNRDFSFSVAVSTVQAYSLTNGSLHSGLFDVQPNHVVSLLLHHILSEGAFKP
jgi:hypothetical protein